jgi:hypothetical protein
MSVENVFDNLGILKSTKFTACAAQNDFSRLGGLENENFWHHLSAKQSGMGERERERERESGIGSERERERERKRES